MVRRLLRSLTVLGSRTYFIAALVTSLVVSAETCANEVTCEDGDEGCGVGGTGGGDPGFKCGNTVCSEALAGSCIVAYQCNEQNKCQGAVEAEGRDDHDKCTIDTCESNEWTHTPYTQEEMDDSDSCTIDECDPTAGIYHTKSC